MSKEADPVLLIQLVQLYHEPNFDTAFKRLTQHLDKSARFLIKMEVKRLLNPCRRVIDMRQHFGNTCQRIEHKNIPHFLPPAGIKEFYRLLKLYKGRYTYGVYEQMLTWEKAQIDSEEGDLKHALVARIKAFQTTEVKPIQFASYHARRDERMHFITPVMILLANGSKLHGKTSDISTGGIRVHVPRIPIYQAGDEVHVIFEELQKESPDVLHDRAFAYQVLADETKGERHWLRLIRSNDDQPDFDQFIEEFIEVNKLKYRVSVDYMLTSVLVKGHEQFFLPRMTGLPLFFSDDPLKLQFVLKNENNRDTLNYWYNENNKNMLSNLFSKSRLTFLTQQSQFVYETIIYCFTHTSDQKIFFYSAFLEELKKQGMRKLFFAFGAKRQNWRVFKCSIEIIGNQEESGIDHSILELAGIHSEHELRKQLEEVTHIGYLQDITDEAHIEDFLDNPPTDLQAKHLKPFCQSVTPKPFDIKTLQYLQLRKEDRYTHRTPALVTISGKKLNGITKDLSKNGLQIELDHPCEAKTGDQVKVTLPELQKMTKHFVLADLPYDIRHLNHDRSIIHLSVTGRKQSHSGRTFLQQLIEANTDQLEATADPQHIPEISTALRNIYTHHLYTYPFFLNHVANRAKLSSLGLCIRKRSLDELFQLCSVNQGYNLYPLFNHKLLRTVLMEPLKTMPREAKPKAFELYIFQRKVKDNLFEFITQHEAEFKDFLDKKRFIQQAINQGKFYSVRLYLSRTGEPDTDFIAKEIDYIAHYAIHRARQLEDELWSIISVGEITDTTEATLFRFGIKSPTNNQK